MKNFVIERLYPDGNWDVVHRMAAESIHALLDRWRAVAVNPILRVKLESEGSSHGRE